MADILHVTPKITEPDSGVNDTKSLAEGLSNVLADTYRLMFKTHSYHWNVTGPLFYPIHKLTEEQYTDLFKAADEIAERIRALGHLAPLQLSELSKRSEIADMRDMPSAREMVVDLAEDHEMIARRLRGIIDMAAEKNDPVTDDLATARIAFHEEAAWMLRATAET